jgi:hypothetical protein
MRKIEVDPTKQKDTPNSWIEGINIVKMFTLPSAVAHPVILATQEGEIRRITV